MRAETYREALDELQMTIYNLKARIAELSENNPHRLKTLKEVIEEYETHELIFKKDVMDVIENIRQRGIEQNYHDDALMIAHEIKSAVLGMESVAKVKEQLSANGKWIPYSKIGVLYRCDQCDHEITVARFAGEEPPEFCPHCGAKMEKGELHD